MIRTAFAPLVHRSWFLPIGTFKFAPVPVMTTVPSPSGFSIVHSDVFSAGSSRLSDTTPPPD
jgi:hypothetical protein